MHVDWKGGLGGEFERPLVRFSLSAASVRKTSEGLLEWRHVRRSLLCMYSVGDIARWLQPDIVTYISSRTVSHVVSISSSPAELVSLKLESVVISRW
jgi:hypothetical protein